jgi:hypothetical protein
MKTIFLTLNKIALASVLMLFLHQESGLSQTLSPEGEYHNSTLEAVRNAQLTTLPEIAAFVKNYTVNNYGGGDMVIFFDNKLLGIITEANNNRSIAMSYARGKINTAFNSGAISSSYRQFLINLTNILEENFGTNDKQLIVNETLSKLNLLKSSTTDIELLAPVNISIASTIYWGGNPKPTGGDVQGFWQLDCVGYIIGWAAAVIEDADSPGGVTPQGGNRRIREGLYGAAGASSGGLYP